MMMVVVNNNGLRSWLCWWRICNTSCGLAWVASRITFFTRYFISLQSAVVVFSTIAHFRITFTTFLRTSHRLVGFVGAYLSVIRKKVFNVSNKSTICKLIKFFVAELLCANLFCFLVSDDPPDITYAMNSSSRSVLLKWSEVQQSSLNGGTLLGYSIFYKKSDERYKADQLKSVPSTATESHVEGLQKWALYTFRVVIFTNNGNGVASKPVTVRTDEDSKLV